MARNIKEAARIKEFREDIQDIDERYPKGDPDEMGALEMGLVGGYNADGYNIK